MQERSAHTPISVGILKANAIEFHQKVTKKDDFGASIGWLNKYKNRIGICGAAIHETF